jgi:hypothetical protein
MSQVRLIRSIVATVALVTALVALSVGSAAGQATELEKVVLCKVSTDPCPAGKSFPVNTTVKWELTPETNAVFLNSTKQVNCAESVGSGLSETTLAEFAIFVEFAFCTDGENCTVKTPMSYLATGELQASHSAYEVLVTRRGSTSPTVMIECSKYKCEFNTTSVLLAQQVGASDVVLKVSQSLTPVGFLCSLLGNFVWDAEYLLRCLESGTPVACWLRME